VTRRSAGPQDAGGHSHSCQDGKHRPRGDAWGRGVAGDCGL